MRQQERETLLPAARIESYPRLASTRPVTKCSLQEWDVPCRRKFIAGLKQQRFEGK